MPTLLPRRHKVTTKLSKTPRITIPKDIQPGDVLVLRDLLEVEGAESYGEYRASIMAVLAKRSAE